MLDPEMSAGASFNRGAARLCKAGKTHFRPFLMSAFAIRRDVRGDPRPAVMVAQRGQFIFGNGAPFARNMPLTLSLAIIMPSQVSGVLRRARVKTFSKSGKTKKCGV